MLRLNINTGKLKEILNLISLPGGEERLMNEVTPTFHPTGELTIMAKSLGTFENLSFRKLDISGISEPIDLKLNCAHILDRLSIFKESDTITFEYDNKGKVTRLFNSLGRSVDIPSKTKKEDENAEQKVHMLKEFPFTLSPEGGILFRGGTLEPSIRGSVPSEKLKDLISFVDKVGINPKIYRMEFIPSRMDGTPGIVKTKAGDARNREADVIKDEFEVPELVGEGIVAYGVGFDSVFKVLTGFTFIETLPGGPMWVSQNTDDSTVQYLLSPAAQDFL